MARRHGLVRELIPTPIPGAANAIVAAPTLFFSVSPSLREAMNDITRRCSICVAAMVLGATHAGCDRFLETSTRPTKAETGVAEQKGSVTVAVKPFSTNAEETDASPPSTTSGGPQTTQDLRPDALVSNAPPREQRPESSSTIAPRAKAPDAGCTDQKAFDVCSRPASLATPTSRTVSAHPSTPGPWARTLHRMPLRCAGCHFVEFPTP